MLSSSTRKALVSILLCVFPLAGFAKEENTGVAALKGYAVFKMGKYQEAFDIWQPLAVKGNTTAMNNIANLYANGLGLDRDLALAAQWLQKSAEMGDSIGQLQLGMAYEQGQGVPKDNQKAAFWFEKSALQGDRDAQFNLGVMLATNFGLNDSPSSEQLEQAKYWLKLANEQNHPEARVFLKLIQ